MKLDEPFLRRGYAVRDWSLLTERGGGGHVKFNPYEKGGGAEKVLAMLKWGGGEGALKVLG